MRDMNTEVLDLFDQLAERNRRALTELFDARHQTFAGTTDAMVQTASKLRQRGWATHAALWNPCLFLNMVAFDLSYLLSDLAHERDAWRRRLTARHLATLLFEISEDLPGVFGRAFNKALDELRAPPELRDKFRSEMKAVSAFWNDNRGRLKEIRQVCGAHRDHDALLLHQSIAGLDLLETLQLGMELSAALNQIGNAAQAILSATAVIEPPEL